MIKMLDKFLPIVCLSIAITLFSNALFVHFGSTANLSLASQNLTTKAEAMKISLDGTPVQKKAKVLLVPGHDSEFFGAFLGKIKEADLTLKTADYLKEILDKDPDLEVYITREPKPPGQLDYTKTFSNYFDQNKTAGDSQSRLYAINDWVNKNEIEVVVHLHFNDYQDRKGIGSYSGFSIYVPDDILPNRAVSQKLATSLFETFIGTLKVSNKSNEQIGVVQNSKLIALDLNNSPKTASALIEYGYIYEKQFTDEETLKKLAEKTAEGVEKYLSIR